MTAEKERNPVVMPSLASMEAESFGALAEFGTKFILLVRESPLSEQNREVVGKRVTAILSEITTEIKGNPTMDLRKRLESAYVDLQLLVDDLSKLEGHGGTTSGL